MDDSEFCFSAQFFLIVFLPFQDEIINLVSSLPLTSVRGPSHVETIGAGEENKEGDVGGREETPHTRSPAISTPQDGLTTQEPEAVPLVVPAALFRPHSYHPMHIFVSSVITYTIIWSTRMLKNNYYFTIIILKLDENPKTENYLLLFFVITYRIKYFEGSFSLLLLKKKS